MTANPDVRNELDRPGQTLDSFATARITSCYGFNI